MSVDRKSDGPVAQPEAVGEAVRRPKPYRGGTEFANQDTRREANGRVATEDNEFFM